MVETCRFCAFELVLPAFLRWEKGSHKIGVKCGRCREWNGLIVDGGEVRRG